MVPENENDWYLINLKAFPCFCLNCFVPIYSKLIFFLNLQQKNPIIFASGLIEGGCKKKLITFIFCMYIFVKLNVQKIGRCCVGISVIANDFFLMIKFCIQVLLYKILNVLIGKQ